MKKLMLCMVACVALLFASCEPQIEDAGADKGEGVEVNTSDMPDSLRVFMENIPENYNYVLSQMRERCDVVIVSYGRNLVFNENMAGWSELPENYVTLVGYNYKGADLIYCTEDFYEQDATHHFGCYAHFSVASIGFTVDMVHSIEMSGYLYQLRHATGENYNTHLYSGDQYVYDIITFEDREEL